VRVTGPRLLASILYVALGTVQYRLGLAFRYVALGTVQCSLGFRYVAMGTVHHRLGLPPCIMNNINSGRGTCSIKCVPWQRRRWELLEIVECVEKLHTQERHATLRIAFNAQVQRAGPAARQRACRRGCHRGDHRCAIAVGKWGRPGPLRPWRTVKGSSSSSSTSSSTSHFFAVRGEEVVRTVGALVLPHRRPEARVAHTTLLLLALRDNRGLLGVRPASDCHSRARVNPRSKMPKMRVSPRAASRVNGPARRPRPSRLLPKNQLLWSEE